MGFLKLIRVTLIYTSKHHCFLLRNHRIILVRQNLSKSSTKKFDIFPPFSTSFKSPARVIFCVLTMFYTVYIIYSTRLDRYYIGYSENVNERLLQHNTGISDYTAKSDDWELKYTEQYSSRIDAMAREGAIKKKKSRRYIEWLISSIG